MPDRISSQDADRVFTRFALNVRRSRRLASLAVAGHDVVRDAADDLLRSSVVLLHAAMEDLLRSIGRLRLPSAEGDVLAAIPLAELGGGLGEDRRFTLRHLAAHRGRRVDDVIYESVSAYLDRKSFSSTDDVVEFLRRLEVEMIDVRPLLSNLAGLIARRHQIVHRAGFEHDHQATPGGWTHDESANLNRWFGALVTFGREVTRQSLPPEEQPSFLSSVAAAVDDA
jgi:hypothetical protein